MQVGICDAVWHNQSVSPEDIYSVSYIVNHSRHATVQVMS